MMDLDELQSVQSRERQTDSLQQLRESFYRDVGAFVDQLRRERDRAAEQADDRWNAPEVSRLTDDIDTAEGTVEAIYERRVGKIVKMASLAAADMPTEDDGLTTEERDLFDTLVETIEHNRLQVETILDGEDPATVADDPPGDASPRPDAVADASAAADDSAPEQPSADGSASEPTDSREIDAADLMGGDADVPGTANGGADPAPPSGGETGRPTDAEPDAATGSDTAGRGPGAPSTAPDTATDSAPEPGRVERETVRITNDVGEIFGVDERRYDLTADDVVTLPADNANPLVERDADERLD